MQLLSEGEDTSSEFEKIIINYFCKILINLTIIIPI